MTHHGITRRSVFAGGAAAGIAALGLGAFAASEPEAGGKWKAAVIGHTSHGDYGHGLDVAFSGRDDVEVMAVADPDAAGRAKAAQRSGAARQYADYREMLEKERPRLVSVGPRWSDQHHAMVLAALRAGAHVLCEKPFTRTPAEADELLDVAQKGGLRIAVAHQMRLSPGVVALKRAVVEQGLIGELVEIHAWGKQDSRAGGEDMMVLGTHLFDLMRLFAGEPKWCSARVLWQGREAAPEDARRATEDIGPTLGSDVSAMFAFEKTTSATFASRPALRQSVGHWGMELIGSKASARILADIHPRVYLRKPGLWDEQGRGGDRWQRWADDPGRNFSAAEREVGPANRRVVDDLLAAIREKREPACSGANAAKAVEMVMAVYRAALAGARATFPLAERGQPLKLANQ